jgi:hypothetical protein
MRGKFAALLLLSLPCVAQTYIPDLRPKLLTFNDYLRAGDALMRAGDAYTTHRFMDNPCHCFYERDPMAPHTGNMAELSLFQGAVSAAINYESRRLEPKHPRWSRALLIGDIASESVAVTNNALLKPRKK